MTVTCLHPLCESNPQPTVFDTNLCGLHLRGLQADVGDIERVTALDAEWHDDYLVATSATSATRSVPSSRPPIRVGALIDGATAEAILGWASDVAQVSRRLGLVEAGRLLAVNVMALAAHDAIDVLALELRDAADHCRGVVPDERWNDAEQDRRAAPLGRCPQPDPRGERDCCGGPLRWRTPAWTSEPDLLAIEVECARCADVWGMSDLPHILRVVQPKRRFPVPRAWVCERYGVALGTLRQWIHKGWVRSYSDEQVDLFDVLARLDAASA
jgi:hypothetical protein